MPADILKTANAPGIEASDFDLVRWRRVIE